MTANSEPITDYSKVHEAYANEPAGGPTGPARLCPEVVWSTDAHGWEAWLQATRALDEVVPGWCDGPGLLSDKAADAIRALKARALQPS